MTVVPGRSRVATTYGIVAASQPLAARAGVQVLERGGHAVDAAIAANAVLGVVEPEMNGIGGDLFAIVYDAETAAVHGLNACGWAPAGLTPHFLASRGIESMPATGVHSVTVPGCAAGWEALSVRFGKLPLADVLAPAVRYAQEGFPVSDIIAERWAGWTDKLAANPDAARTYLPRGRAPRKGEVFSNPALAASLCAYRRERRARLLRGPDRRRDRSSIGQHTAARSTAADLREFAPEWVDPISTIYRGWTVFELPPNTQGIAALMMLNLMEQFPARRVRVSQRGAPCTS